MADDNARIAAVIDKMRTDGASHAQILEFVKMVKVRREGKRADALTKPSWTSDDPSANSYSEKEAPSPHVSMKPSAEESAAFEALPWYKKAAHVLTGDLPETNAAKRGLEAFTNHEPGWRGVLQTEDALKNVVAGGFAGGALGAAGEALLPAGKAAGRVIAATSGAGAGATQMGLDARTAHEPVLPAALEGAGGGSFLGTAGHLLGEAAGAGSKLLRKGNGLVARYLRAKDAAVYNDPAMAALPGKEEGIQKASEIGNARVMARDAELDQQASEVYQAALDPPGPRPASKPPIRVERPDPPRADLGRPPAEPLTPEQIRAIHAEPPPPVPEAAMSPSQLKALLRVPPGTPVEGAPPLTPPTVREQLLGAGRTSRPKPQMVEQEPWPPEGLDRPTSRDAQLATLERERAKNIDPDTKMPISPAVEARYQRAIEALGPEGTTTTVRGTLARRRGLREDASFGNPAPSPEQLASRKVYGGYRQAVRDAAPDIAAADDAYSAHARQASRRRDILTRSETPPSAGTRPGEVAPDAELADGPQGAAADLASEPGMRVSKEMASTTMLGREGDTNVPGLKAQRYLDELKTQDPEFASALEFIGNKKALEGTRFGAPHLATHLGGATSHGSVAGVQIPLRYVGQNLRAMARPLDAALTVGEQLKLAAPFSGAVANPLFEANEKRRKKGHRQ